MYNFKFARISLADLDYELEIRPILWCLYSTYLRHANNTCSLMDCFHFQAENLLLDASGNIKIAGKFDWPTD